VAQKFLEGAIHELQALLAKGDAPEPEPRLPHTLGMAWCELGILLDEIGYVDRYVWYCVCDGLYLRRTWESFGGGGRRLCGVHQKKAYICNNFGQSAVAEGLGLGAVAVSPVLDCFHGTKRVDWLRSGLEHLRNAAADAEGSADVLWDMARMIIAKACPHAVPGAAVTTHNHSSEEWIAHIRGMCSMSALHRQLLEAHVPCSIRTSGSTRATRPLSLGRTSAPTLKARRA
jgi:hypothetical protein